MPSGPGKERISFLAWLTLQESEPFPKKVGNRAKSTGPPVYIIQDNYLLLVYVVSPCPYEIPVAGSYGPETLRFGTLLSSYRNRDPDAWKNTKEH